MWQCAERTMRLFLLRRTACVAFLVLFLQPARSMDLLWPDDSVMPAGSIVIPQGPSVWLGLSGSYGGSTDIAVGDSISILPSTKSCQSGADFEDAASADLTAVILDNSARAFFDFSQAKPQSGYQICVCPVASQSANANGKLVCADGAAFTDINTITVQDRLVSLVFKGQEAAHLTLPIENCGAQCTRAQSVDIAYRSGPLVNKGLQPFAISIIPVTLSCSEARENVATPTFETSGFLLLDDSTQRQIYDIEYVTRMAEGSYKVCQKPDDQSLFNWRDSGITIVLQRQVVGINVNEIFGFVASAPNVAGVPIQICKNLNCTQPWAPEDRISIIPIHSDCRDVAVANPSSTGPGVSGHMSLSASGVLGRDELDLVLESSLPVGTYVLCFDVSSTGFQRSGLVFRVQDMVLGLEVNGILPNNGLRVSVPKSPGTAMRYISRTEIGVAGDSIAFIEFDKECSDLCLTVQTQACDPTNDRHFAHSGFLSAHGDDKRLGNSSCLGDHDDFQFACSKYGKGNREADFSRMVPGRYKTCFRPASLCAFQTCWPLWMGTGVVLEVQDQATGFMLNYAGGLENTGHGQRLVAPKQDYHKLALFGARAGEIAFQRKEVDCAEEDFGATVNGIVTPHHDFDQQQIDAAFGLNGVLSLDAYQICFRPQGAAAYINTGVGLRLQDDITGLDINGVRANRGLRTAMPVQTSSRLTFFRPTAATDGDSVSFIRLDKDCWNPQHNPPVASRAYTGHMNLSYTALYGGLIPLLHGSDVVASMDAGWYKVCFRSNSSRHIPVDVEIAFVETGLTVRLQQELVSLYTNTRVVHWRAAGSNRGVRVTLPKATGNKLVASHAGTLSFIAVSADCADTVNDNPSRDDKRRPLWLEVQDVEVSRQALDILLSGDKSGTLQVCHAPPMASEFSSTGLSLTVQELVVGIVVNDIRPNFGIRVAVPKRTGNVAFFESRGSDGSGTLSLIDMFGDCSLASDNPSAPAPELNASGPIESSLFALLDTSVFAMMNPGEYQICFKSALSAEYVAAGLTLMIQDQALALEVNSVNQIASATPRVPESQIAYCRDEACALSGYAQASISFIQAFQECEDEVLQNPARGAAGRSGYFHLDNTNLDNTTDPSATRMISSEASASMLSEEGTLGSGSYQVCFSTGSGFLSTGLSLQVQDKILGLEVNFVSPNYGLRVAIPKVPSGTELELAYLSQREGATGDAISLISLTGTCSVLTDNPAAQQAPAVSGHIDADGVTKFFSNTAVLSSLEGQYQVCYRHGQENFATTGLSATIQTLATGVDAICPPGATCTPLQAGLEKGALPAESRLSIQGSLPDTIASFVLPARSCANAVDNPESPTPAASGHMAVIQGEVQLNYDAMDNPALIQELTYQLCIVDSQGTWQSTGIAVTVNWKCLEDATVQNSVFKKLQVDESNNIAGAMNAIHVIMETEPRLPPGSVLRVKGLKGSLTTDNAQLDVFGNSIRSETIPFACQGNGSCVLDLDGYSPPGTIIFSASLGIELVCTDFDSCDETIESVVLVSEGKTEDLTPLIDFGPWSGCIANCDKSVPLIQNHNVIDIAGKRGRPMQIRITATDKTNFHTCSGWTLSAQVKLTLQYSILSTRSFFGSWTRSSGILAVPFVPFEDSDFIHITFVLRNPTRENIPQPRPFVSLCAIESGAGTIGEMESETLLSTKDNVLKADLAPRFATAEIVESSQFVNERNRIHLRLRTNLPFLLPRGLSLTISGLTGTQTSDTSQLRLLDASQVTQIEYPCSGGRSCTITLDTRAAAGTLFHRATLDVSLFCTDFRAYPTKYIREIRVCNKAVGAAACPDTANLPFPDDTYSRGPWQDCDSCRQSTRPVMRSYDLTEVISVYGPEFNMEILASEGVGDLKCYASLEVQSVRAAVVLSIEYSRNSGIWANQKGELVVTGEALAAAMACTSSGDLSCFPQVSYTFEVRNSPTEQQAVTPVLEAIGGGLIFPKQELQPTLATSFRQSYVLLSKSIAQSTRKKGEVGTQIGLNTLTVSISVEEPIPGGTRVTITGLTGTQTQDAGCQEVMAPRCAATPPHCIFQSVETGPCHYGMQLLGEDLGTDLAGSWNQETGTLIFVVQRSFQAMRTITLSFKVYNRATAQPPVVAMVSASNPNGYTILSTPLDGEVLQSDEDNIPLEAVAPEILSAVAVEYDKKEYQNNTIELSAVPNLPLSRGSLITLQGFKTSLLAPSMGGVWFSDALPNVESVDVAGNHVQPNAAWQDAVTEAAGWICQGGSWYTTRDSFENAVIFREQSWCSIQPAYSVVTALNSCVNASENLKFSFTLRNNAIPPAIPDPPTLEIQSQAAVFPRRTAENIIYHDERVRQCSGSFSCILSIMHTSDASCYEDSCRILPPMARLLNATIDVNVACANFALDGQFVDRVTACRVPDCGAQYDSTHTWDVFSNACCVAGRNCQPYDCLSPVVSFERGPWQGCAGNCSDSRPVVRSYSVMDILCSDANSCYDPTSFVFYMSISSAADVVSCSGQDTYTQAQVTLNLQYKYESVAFASEIARLDIFDVVTSNDVQGAETDIVVRMQAQSPLGPGSTINISNLLGTQTPDSEALTIENLDCDGVEDRFCTISESKVVAGTGVWTQHQGQLSFKIESFLPLGQMFSFRFRLTHSAEVYWLGRRPVAWVHSVTTGEQIEQVSSSVVLRALDVASITQGVISQANVLQRQDNQIGVSFRCNLDLRKGNTITVTGLKGTPTRSGPLEVTFDGVGTKQVVTGFWNREGDSLALSLPSDRLPLEVVSFSFTLRNGGGPQTGTGVEVVVVPSGGTTGALKGELVGQALTATESPLFERSRIYEAVQVYGQMNHFEVTFRTSVFLPLGSLVVVDNLVGAESPSSEVHPITVQLLGCDSPHEMVGNWDRANSKLSLFLPSQVAVSDEVSIKFALLNPAQPQSPTEAKLSAISPFGVLAFNPIGRVLGASVEAAFVTAAVGQSSRVSGQDSRVTLLLRANIDLVPGMQLAITGLTGLTVSSLELSGPSSSSFLSPAPYTAATGLLTLFPVATVEYQEDGEPMVLVWSQQTPNSGSNSISAELFQGAASIIQSSTLEGSAVSTTRGTVTLAEISESSLVKSAPNHISVHIQLDVPISFGVVLTLSGMSGALTPDTVDLEVSGASAFLFGSKGVWNQAAGSIEVEVVAESYVPAGESIRFGFEIDNPSSANPSGSAIDVRADAILSAPGAFATRIMFASDDPRFESPSIVENNAVRSMINELTIATVPNMPLFTGATIRIQPLSGANFIETVTWAANGQQQTTLGNWSSVDSEVTFQLSANVEPHSTFVVSFSVINPPSRQSSVTVTMSATSTDPFGITTSLESELAGRVLSSAESPGFDFTDLEESSRLAGGRNRISMVLQSNAILEPGYTLRILNLVGTDTLSGPIDVEEEMDSLGLRRLNSTGIFWPSHGLLEVGIVRQMPQNFRLKFTFVLQNSAVEQTPILPEAMVEMQGMVFIPRTAVASSDVIWNDGIERWRGDVPPEFVNGQILSASESHLFTKATVSEQNAVAGQPSTLYFSFLANSDIYPGALVTITGLKGSGSNQLTTSGITIGQVSGDTQGQSWTPITGVLIVSVRDLIVQGEELAFSMPIQNPAAAQTSVRPVVTVNMVNPFTTLGVTIPAFPVSPESGQTCCLGGDALPTFVAATVRESTAVKGQVNVLYFNLRSSIPLLTNTRITISNLIGSATFDTSDLVISNSSTLRAQWRQATGTLLFNLDASMYVCDCVYPCDRNNLEFSVQLTNEIREQTGGVASVQASRDGLNGVVLESAFISGEVLRARDNPNFFAAIYEASNVTGQLNTISVSLRANFALAVCQSAWIQGVGGWLDTANSVQNSDGEPIDDSKLFDGTAQTFVQFPQSPNQIRYLVFDFQEPYRLEAIRIISYTDNSGVQDVMLQYGDSPTGQTWTDAMDARFRVELGVVYQQSPRFKAIASRYWRLVMYSNYNPVVYLRTIVSDISFFGCPDRETHAIVLSNLTGTRTESNMVMPITSESRYGSVRSFGQWNQTLGTLFVKIDDDVKAFDELTFRFTVQNANAGQHLRRANIEVVEGEEGKPLPPAITAIGQVLASNEESIFVVREISESSQFRSDLNTLKIVLQANVPLRGSQGTSFRIVFSRQYFANMLPLVDKSEEQFLCVTEVRTNVPCFTGNTVPARADLFEVLFRASGATDIHAKYADSEPSMIVKLYPDAFISEGTRMEFDIVVVNPATMQRQGFSPSVEGDTLSRRVMNGEVMQGTRVGLVFSTRTLTETSRMALAQNVLTATLVPGTSLSQATVITISGLQGTKNPDGFGLFDSVEPGGILSSTYEFLEDRLLVTVQQTWEAGTEIVLSFKIQNGESVRKQRIEIVANRGITIANDMCRMMDPGVPGQCLLVTDVLRVDTVPGIVAAHIQQSNSVQGQQNLITVSLLPNVEVLQGSMITITGLTGTTTPDNTLAGLSGEVAHLLNIRSWIRVSGELVLQATGSLNSPTSSGFTFSFFVTNELTEQPKPSVRYCASFSNVKGHCGLARCDVLGRTELGVEDGSTNCTGKAILNVTDPLFLRSSGAVQLLVNDISEATNVPDQDNVITVRLSSNVVLRPGVLLSIHGLVSSQTADDMELPVHLSNQECDSWEFAPMCPAIWRQQQGMLVISVANAVAATTDVLTVSFVIRNPSSAQAGYASAMLTADLGTAARFNAVKIRGSVLKADGMAKLLDFSVLESTTVHRQKNILSATVRANIDLAQGSVITVAGLRGHDASDFVLCDPTSQARTFGFDLPPVEVQFDGVGTPAMSNSFRAAVEPTECDLVTSTLTVSLPRGYRSEENVVFHFAVFNKEKGSNGTIPTVSVSGCRAGLTAAYEQICAHTVYTAPSAGRTCSAPQQLQGLEGCSLACPRCIGDALCAPCSQDAGDYIDLAPMRSATTILGEGSKQQFFVLSAAESTNAVSLLNTITVSLQLNVALEPGTAFRLSGFNKSQTDSTELFLFGSETDAVSYRSFGTNGTALWNSVAGTLTLTTAESIPTGQLIVIDFKILNPGKQTSAVCLNGRNYCEENSRIFSGSGLNKGRECPEVGLTCAGECKFRHPFCSNDATLNCTGASEGCSICISPNNGAYCPSTAVASTDTTPKSALLLPADAPNVAVECFPTSAACNRETHCVAPNTLQECDRHTQCTGPYDPFVPESDWVNRLGPQRCVRLSSPAPVFCGVSGPRVDIPKSQMDGSVLGFSSPQPPAFISRRISQSTRVPGELNQLTVRLTSNFPMLDMATTHVTISGFPADLDVKLSEFREGANAGQQLVALFLPERIPVTSVQTGCAIVREAGDEGSELDPPVGPDPETPVDPLPAGNVTQRRDGHGEESSERPFRYSCNSIGANLTSDQLYFSALLNLRVECPLVDSVTCLSCIEDETPESHESCFLIQDVGIRNLQTFEEVPAGIGAFRSSPCVGDGTKCMLEEEVTIIPAQPGIPEREVRRTKRVCMILEQLDVLSFVQSARSDGFAIEIVTASADLIGLEAELLVTVTDSFGRWEQVDENVSQLVVNGAEAPLTLADREDGTEMAFSFQARNFETPHESPTLTVVGDSGLVRDAGLCVDEIDAGCEAFRKDAPPVPSQARTIVSGEILQADQLRELVVTTIKETSGLPGRVNVLTVELSTNSNVTIPPGTEITITGLTGTLTEDTDSLPVVGTGIIPTGRWTQSTGTLVVQLLTEYGSFQAPLLITFELLNPPQAQEPVQGVVVMAGPTVYGPQTLVCITTPDCSGVLSGSTEAAFTQIAIAERHRYANELNFVTWFIATSIPIQRNDARIVIQGLNITGWTAGNLNLARNPGEVQRAAECEGLRSCVLELPSRAPRGTIMTFSTLQLWLTCEGLLELQELYVCQTPVPRELLLATQCFDPSKLDEEILSHYDVSTCNREDIAVLAEGIGTISLRGLLTLHYSFDVTSEATWEPSLGTLSIQVNRNTTSQSPTLLDPTSIAFSLGVMNPPNRQSPTNVTITVAWDLDDIAINRSVQSTVLQSGVVKCTGLVVLNASGEYSDVLPDTSPVEYPGDGLSLYNEPLEEGEESCMVLIQPNNTRNWLVRMTITDFDFDEDRESLTVFDGDSPEAIELVRLYKTNRVNINDARYFAAARPVWSQACTTTLQMRVTRQALPGEPFIGAVTSGRQGFSLKYSLVDPEKMNHLKANISLQGLLGPLDDEWSLLRLRKILGATNQVSHAFVIFENIAVGSSVSTPSPIVSDGGNATMVAGNQSSRRFEAEGARLSQAEQAMQDRGRHGRRLLQTTAMTLQTRMLANDPQEAVTFAKGLTQALFSRGVTTEMNNQGIVGSASLIDSVQVFRCGFELECVPAEPTTPEPVILPPNITTTPEPFPLDEIIRIGLAIVVGPTVLGICCCCGILFYMFKDRRTRQRKTKEAITAWLEYFGNRKKELLAMDAYDKEKESKRVFNKKLEKEEFEERVEEMIKTHFNKMLTKTRYIKETEEFEPFMYKEHFKWLPVSYYEVEQAVPMAQKRAVANGDLVTKTENGNGNGVNQQNGNGNGVVNVNGEGSNGILENGNALTQDDIMDENEPDPEGMQGEEEEDAAEEDAEGEDAGDQAGVGTEEVHLAV